MTSFTIWLIVGGIVGWLASTALRERRDQAVLPNVVSGCVGAFAGSLVLGRGMPLPPDTSLLSFVSSILGAIALVAVTKLVCPGVTR